jgi:Cu/Ag efflux protein CusF
MIKDKKDKVALQKAKILKQQLYELKKHSIKGMKAIIETISSIDENSKKILFKHFDQANVNILSK